MGTVKYCIIGTGFAGTCTLWHLVQRLTDPRRPGAPFRLRPLTSRVEPASDCHGFRGVQVCPNLNIKFGREPASLPINDQVRRVTERRPSPTGARSGIKAGLALSRPAMIRWRTVLARPSGCATSRKEADQYWFTHDMYPSIASRTDDRARRIFLLASTTTARKEDIRSDRTGRHEHAYIGLWLPGGSTRQPRAREQRTVHDTLPTVPSR